MTPLEQIEGGALQRHHAQPGLGKIANDTRKRIAMPRLRPSGQLGRDLHDHIGYPHLAAQLPQPVRSRRNKLNDFHHQFSAASSK